MKRSRTQGLIAIVISLLLSVNSVYAADMLVIDMAEDQGATKAHSSMQKCHEDAENSTSSDAIENCCNSADCQLCLSAGMVLPSADVFLLGAGHPVQTFNRLSSSLAAHASNLFRPPIIS